MDAMGNRPSSTLIWGFDYKHDWDSDEPCFESDYGKDEAWTKICCEQAGVPHTRPDDMPYSEWSEKRDVALKANCTYVPWAYRDEPSHAFGLVIAHGDWDAAEEVTMMTPPENAEALVAKCCAFYGVKPQPLKLLMLSSYG